MSNTDLEKFFREQKQTHKDQYNVNDTNRENVTQDPTKKNLFTGIVYWLFGRSKKSKNR